MFLQILEIFNSMTLFLEFSVSLFQTMHYCFNVFYNEIQCINLIVIVHLSWKVKRGFLIACFPSSVRRSFCKYFPFSTYSLKPMSQFEPNLARTITWQRIRGDDCNVVKLNWQLLKIFFRTLGKVLTSFGTKHPWFKMN